MAKGESMRNKVFAVILIIVLAILVFQGVGFAKEYFASGTKENGQAVEVTIEQGTSKKEMAKLLKEKGLIKSSSVFLLKAKNSSYGNKIRYGTFDLNTGMSIEEILKTMSSEGQQKEAVKVVIPEGYTIELIAKRLEEAGLCTVDEFLAAVQETYDYEFLNDIPAEIDAKYRLQGFLFPATYEFYADATASEIVSKMLSTFGGYVTAEDRAKAKEMNLTIFEVVTRASIIERESKVFEERPIIAGVINNRLALDMKLQMCPTVLYPLTDGLYNKPQVFYKDLEVDSPYNTYKYKGLPVGPICSPGMSSIKAVLAPETHDYLFYHTDDESIGNHIFTKTYEEHEDSRIKK